MPITPDQLGDQIFTDTVTNKPYTAGDTPDEIVHKVWKAVSIPLVNNFLQVDQGSGVNVQNSSVSVGVAGTLNFTGSAISSVTNTSGTITVTINSGAGAISVTTGNIVDGAVTLPKMANLAQDTLIGRATASTGVPEAVPLTAAGRALIAGATSSAQRSTLGLGTLSTQNGTFSGTSSGTNTGDQSLATLTDTTINAQTAGQILKWNGTAWENSNSAVSAGPAKILFFNDTIVAATGSENSISIQTLDPSPLIAAEEVNSVVLSNTTVALQAALSTSAVGRTTWDAGLWQFSIFGAVDALGGVSQLLTNIMRVRIQAETVTMTGSGTTRTATASGGTPFAVAAIDPSSTVDAASYIQTPKGLYQILTRTSDTVVTIATPAGYVNESAVSLNVWKKLFQTTSGEISSLAPSYTLYASQSVQDVFTTLSTDKMGTLVFATTTRNAATTIYFVHTGNTHFSNILAPFVPLHNDLSGLQGGSAAERYHLTNAQLTVVQNTSGVNTGDQTNISGNAATVTTNANLTGPVTSIGNATAITNNSVTNSNLRQSAGLSIIGRSANTTGNIADITAGTDGQLLIRSGTNLSFTSINLSFSSSVVGALAVGNGGTGQTTKAAAFDALSPTASKGDIIANSGAGNFFVSVGPIGSAIVSNSSSTLGISFKTLTSFTQRAVTQATSFTFANPVSSVTPSSLYIAKTTRGASVVNWSYSGGNDVLTAVVNFATPSPSFTSSTVLSGTAVSVTTNAARNITSLVLPPGEWDLTGIVSYSGALISGTRFSGTLNIVSQTAGTAGDNMTETTTPPTSVCYSTCVIPNWKISASVSTTVWLIAQATFTSGTLSAFGRLSGRCTGPGSATNETVTLGVDY